MNSGIVGTYVHLRGLGRPETAGLTRAPTWQARPGMVAACAFDATSDVPAWHLLVGTGDGGLRSVCADHIFTCGHVDRRINGGLTITEFFPCEVADCTRTAAVYQRDGAGLITNLATGKLIRDERAVAP